MNPKIAHGESKIRLFTNSSILMFYIFSITIGKKQQEGLRGNAMKTGKIITTDSEIRDILEKSRTIAILGLSPKPERDANRVARYLQEKGYRIIPVRPGQEAILGETAYASLNDINEPIDIVDVFRNPDQILPHAQEALRVKPKVFWMQLNIENQAAATLLIDHGIDVIMNRCIKIEHDRLFK